MQKVLAGLVVAVLIFIGVKTFAEKETRTMLQVSNLSYSCCGGGIGSGGCGAASGSWKRLFGFSSEDPVSSKNQP